MWVTVKILKGKECSIEVTASMSISSVKKVLAGEFDIPENQQKLIFRGKTLTDGQCLCDYNIIDGTKLHLIRQFENSEEQEKFWDDLSTFLRKHFSQHDCRKVFNQFKKDYDSSLALYSLDDFERIAIANQRDSKSQQSSSHITSENTTATLNS